MNQRYVFHTEWRLPRAPDGTSRWTVQDDGTAVFDEDVVVRQALVRVAGRLARPALRLNHDLMMREGERGLGNYLEHG